MKQISESFIKEELKFIRHSLVTGEYTISQAAGHLTAMKHHSIQLQQNDIRKLIETQLDLFEGQMGGRVILDLASPQHTQEIIHLGGRDNQHNFVATRNGQVIGFLWGQVGDGEIYYLTSREMMLEYIHANVKREGHGRMMVLAIFDQLPVDTIYGETNEKNKAFWKSLGATLEQESYDNIREIYEFTLNRENCYKALYNKRLLQVTSVSP